MQTLSQPSPGPKQQRRQANQERILAGATALVVEGGIEALSMNRLAHQLDYTPGALYRYFASKERLLAAVITRAIVDLLESLEHPGLHTGTALERIVRTSLRFRDAALAAPERYGLIAMMMAHPQTLIRDRAEAEPARLAVEEALQPFILCFHQAQEQALLADGEPGPRALILISSLQGVLQLRKQTRFAPELIDVRRLAAEAIRTLLIGWGAAPRQIDAALAATGELS